jgi:hypothetical protein
LREEKPSLRSNGANTTVLATALFVTTILGRWNPNKRKLNLPPPSAMAGDWQPQPVRHALATTTVKMSKLIEIWEQFGSAPNKPLLQMAIL